MDLATPVAKLFLVGPAYAKRLQKLEISSVADLLYHFPFRYIDYTLVSPIAQLQPGEIVSVKGKLISIKNLYTRSRKQIQLGVVADKTGSINVVWFNQRFLVKALKAGDLISLSGRVDFWDRKIALISPEYEKEKAGPSIHTGRLVPVYHETYGVSSKWLRSRIAPLLKSVVTQVEEFLPAEICQKEGLIKLNQALNQIHFPQTQRQAEMARKRFAFEELFLLQLIALERKKEWQQKKVSQKLKVDQEKLLLFLNNLPFELTQAQARSLKEILKDLGSSKPMNRLLEGDVGSGKTVVAAAAIFVAYLNGAQSALMAPTSVLAQQHFQTLNQLLTPLGVKIRLLTGASKKKIDSQADLTIGTHALIYQRASFSRLGLVVIDEQHRFGVEQRGELIQKGKAPHVLTMTATPIPRTIALTLYGDLDLSILDQMPPGRQKVKTWVVPQQKRAAAYQWIKAQIKKNQTQAFVICPLIEESEHETLQTVKAATVEFERLKREVFPDLKLGLLHGRLKAKGKDQVLAEFKAQKLDILVSTPVVEVGIDVPNATLMVIEGAERFGLAQLHQLRGRVGRGSLPSYCLLFSAYHDPKTWKRLRALEKTNLGMELAELDLQMRGPGEVFGTQQHGFIQLKVASFADLELVRKTKKAAEAISGQLADFPLLQARLKAYIIKPIKAN